MLSESKAEGAEPLALMMIGSMERGTIYETVTLNVISSPFSSLLLDLCIDPSACLLVCLSVSLSLCQSICLSILRSYTPSSSLSPPPLFHTHTHTHTGNKVFRYRSWEVQQLHAQLLSAQLADTVPVAGLYSYGAFTRLQDSAVGKSGSLCALMYVLV